MPPPDRLPPQVLAAHRGWEPKHVWGTEYNTAVWRLESPDGAARFAKVGWTGFYPSLDDERARLEWCAGRIAVPELIDHGSDGRVEWLVTNPLRGISAAEDEMKRDPAWLVPFLGEALRAFHETLPVDDCPFDFRLDAAIAHCASRIEQGRETWDDLHQDFKHMTPQEALQHLYDTRPSTEDVVVCHGDYCFPNVLIEDGRVTGYLDLGELGVADRWWDIAVGAWSTTWNVDPRWEPLFYEGYGVEPDPERIRFYRLMYDLAS
jgi:kanamycin kinase